MSVETTFEYDVWYEGAPPLVDPPEGYVYEIDFKRLRWRVVEQES